MMTQTLAILHDAYRELNAKKLFWIVLALSGVVVLAFAGLGINEEGLQILWWTIEVPMFNTGAMSEETFYKITFHNLGIGIWLTWIATVLALVSTASIIPDFISSGSIDLMLSKPIGRLRLFLTKYIAGLLFVTLQVAVFTVCSFLVIGIRGGAWELSLFLAIPVVVLFFSYLFSICTLLGLLTRSTIASLLLTILFWFLIFAVSTTEFIFLDQRVGKEMAVLSGEEQVQVRLDRLEEARRTVEQLTTEPEAQPALTPPVEHPEGAKAGEQQASGDAAAEAPVDTDLAEARERLERLQGQLESKQEQLERARKQERTWSRLHWYAYAGKTILPKTSETVELLNRVLVTTEEMEGFVDAQREQMPAPPTSDEIHVDAMDKQLELEKRIRARSLGWVIGTSLGFEFVILAFGGWIFCRRDF